MKRTNPELIRIVATGGGLIIDCTDKTAPELIRIVAAGKKNIIIDTRE